MSHTFKTDMSLNVDEESLSFHNFCISKIETEKKNAMHGMFDLDFFNNQIQSNHSQRPPANSSHLPHAATQNSPEKSITML